MAVQAGSRVPTRLSAAVFRARAAALQLRRAVKDHRNGLAPCVRGQPADFPVVLAESRSPLWTPGGAEEYPLLLGKVQNLRCAVHRLNGAAIPAGSLFSFWKQVGRATRRGGYVAGRQLLEGCLVPAVGGGLCQLSNALYDAAQQAGLEIVERHPHSRIVPGSAAEAGRDATVAWNYIDLRFRATAPVLIEAFLTAEELVARLRGTGPIGPVVPPLLPVLEPYAPPGQAAHSCASCGVERCFRHAPTASSGAWESRSDATAFLMDDGWPEFRRYVAGARKQGDRLGLPLDGARWRQPRYVWDTAGFERVVTATWETLARSVAGRRLGKYGAARLQAQLDGAAGLARSLSRALTPQITRACVAQSLLPFLWREGHLGGRRFEVLMTRLPLAVLHRRLDAALAVHPERSSLGEFRAPGWLVDAEAEALAVAERIVTPHAEIAALFAGRALLLEWELPMAAPVAPQKTGPFLFPGPTAARKGAYELRAVARRLNLEVLLVGSELEGERFWEGVRTRRVVPAAGVSPLEGVRAVVQPAWVEDRPHLLLRALAAGIPVVATEACGLAGQAGLELVPPGDEAELEAAMGRLVA